MGGDRFLIHVLGVLGRPETGPLNSLCSSFKSTSVKFLNLVLTGRRCGLGTRGNERKDRLWTKNSKGESRCTMDSTEIFTVGPLRLNVKGLKRKDIQRSIPPGTSSRTSL